MPYSQYAGVLKRALPLESRLERLEAPSLALVSLGVPVEALASVAVAVSSPSLTGLAGTDRGSAVCVVVPVQPVPNPLVLVRTLAW